MRYEIIEAPGFYALALFDIPSKKSPEVCTHLMIASKERCNEVLELMLDGSRPEDIGGWVTDPQNEVLKLKSI